MTPFAESALAREWLTTLEKPLLAIVIGASTTALLQSSSATIALVIALASTGVLPLHAGVGVMLRAEIGTCADTIVAAIGKSRQALYVGVFHLFFNASAAIMGVIMLDQLTGLAAMLANHTEGRIAAAQLIFNTASSAIAFIAIIAYNSARRKPNPALLDY